MPSRSGLALVLCLTTSSIAGCSAVPAIASSTLSAVGAWYSYRAATAETVQVLARECVFARQIRIEPGTVLTREDKMQIAAHNMATERICGALP